MSSISKFFGRVGNTFRRMTSRRNRNSSPTRSALHRNVEQSRRNYSNTSNGRSKANNVSYRLRKRRENRAKNAAQHALERRIEKEANQSISHSQANYKRSHAKANHRLETAKKRENNAFKKLENAQKDTNKVKERLKGLKSVNM
jgi:DNA anti-recombination protein RmuC